MAINYSNINSYDEAVNVYNVNLAVRKQMHDSIVGKHDIKEMDKDYIYFNNEDEFPTNLYNDFDLFGEQDKKNIKVYLDSFDDEIELENLVYKYDKDFNYVIQLNSINDFCNCSNGEEYSCERYNSFLNVLNEDELKLECKKNYYMYEQLKYRYNVFCSYIMLDIIQPAKSFLKDDESLNMDESEFINMSNKEIVEKLNDRINKLLEKAQDTNDTIDSLDVNDKIDPIQYDENIKKNINEYAYETLKYFYRINALISRMSYEFDFNKMVLGEETNDKFKEELSYFSENNLEMMLGIAKTEDGYDYDERLRGMTYLEYAFDVLNDDAYDIPDNG